jgi:dephospho-CoA kinase
LHQLLFRHADATQLQHLLHRAVAMLHQLQLLLAAVNNVSVDMLFAVRLQTCVHVVALAAATNIRFERIKRSRF